MTTKTKLMMLGPPGAGKGTQALKLAAKLNIPQISTGDMLREARRKGSDLGKKAATYMDSGGLVPDDVVIGIVRERLAEEDAQGGFILDGFPRTREQAEALAGMGIELDAVINIQVGDAEIVRRISKRRSCPNCGAVYHLEFSPPQNEDVCDKCGHHGLIQRRDDTDEVIVERQAAYRAKTSPLVAFYEESGSLLNIDGEGDPETISARIDEALDD